MRRRQSRLPDHNHFVSKKQKTKNHNHSCALDPHATQLLAPSWACPLSAAGCSHAYVTPAIVLAHLGTSADTRPAETCRRLFLSAGDHLAPGTWVKITFNAHPNKHETTWYCAYSFRRPQNLKPPSI
jgi:hypothetical protein